MRSKQSNPPPYRPVITSPEDLSCQVRQWQREQMDTLERFLPPKHRHRTIQEVILDTTTACRTILERERVEEAARAMSPNSHFDLIGAIVAAGQPASLWDVPAFRESVRNGMRSGRSMPFCVLDTTTGVILEWNLGMECFTGFHRDLAMDSHFTCIFEPKDLQAWNTVHASWEARLIEQCNLDNVRAEITLKVDCIKHGLPIIEQVEWVATMCPVVRKGKHCHTILMSQTLPMGLPDQVIRNLMSELPNTLKTYSGTYKPDEAYSPTQQGWEMDYVQLAQEGHVPQDEHSGAFSYMWSVLSTFNKFLRESVSETFRKIMSRSKTVVEFGSNARGMPTVGIDRYYDLREFGLSVGSPLVHQAQLDGSVSPYLPFFKLGLKLSNFILISPPRSGDVRPRIGICLLLFRNPTQKGLDTYDKFRQDRCYGTVMMASHGANFNGLKLRSRMHSIWGSKDTGEVYYTRELWYGKKEKLAKGQPLKTDQTLVMQDPSA